MLKKFPEAYASHVATVALVGIGAGLPREQDHDPHVEVPEYATGAANPVGWALGATGSGPSASATGAVFEAQPLRLTPAGTLASFITVVDPGEHDVVERVPVPTAIATSEVSLENATPEERAVRVKLPRR